jgi:hypothetical protein
MAVTRHAELIKEIDRLPQKYLGEVIDFVGFLRQKAHRHNDCAVVYPETMLLSEDVLSRDWDTPEEDEAWANL